MFDSNYCNHKKMYASINILLNVWIYFQYIKNKWYRLWIKEFKLRIPPCYTIILKVLVYDGKEGSAENSVGTKIVMELSDLTTFIIVEGLNEEGILESDFLDTYKTIINYEIKIVIFHLKEITEVPFIRTDNYRETQNL